MTQQFFEDFEDNDWSINWGQAQPDGSGLNITTDAAYAGTYGGEAEVTNADVAQASITFSEVAGVAHFGFRFNRNDAVATNNDREGAFLTTGGTVFSQQLKFLFRRDSGGNYIIRVVVRNDIGSETTLDGGTLPAGWNTVEVVLTRATSSVSGDGTAELFINGVSAATSGNYDNFDNYAGIESLDLEAFSFSGGGSGTFYVDDITVEDDDTTIFPATTETRVLRMASDTTNLYVTALKDGTLELYKYDLDTLTENGTINTFGSGTNTELDDRTRGIFPAVRPGTDKVLWLYGRDGNNVQVQKNDLNGTAGWVDQGPGTATWGTAKYAVAFRPSILRPDDWLAAFSDDDIYRQTVVSGSWAKQGDATSGLRTGTRHYLYDNELLMAGTVAGTIHYSHNFGATFDSASIDGVATVTESDVADTIGFNSALFGFSTGTFTAGSSASGISTDGFVHLPSVYVLNGATPSNAYIRFTAAANASGTTNLVIYGEDADDPVAVSSGADYTSRTRTGGSVLWTPADWTSGQTYDTPDISTIVQEIAGRAGFAAGNQMQVFVEHVSGTNGITRQASDATLYIEFVTTAGTIEKIEVSL